MNYWDGLKDKAQKAFDDEDHQSVIKFYQDYLKFEEDVSAENKSFYYERMASSYKSQDNQGKAEEFLKKQLI